MSNDVNFKRPDENKINQHISPNPANGSNLNPDNSNGTINWISDSVNEWIWEIDNNGHFLFSNSQSRKLTGYDSNELIGTNISNYVPTEDFEVVKQFFKTDHTIHDCALGFRFRSKHDRLINLETKFKEVYSNNGSNKTLCAITGAVISNPKINPELDALLRALPDLYFKLDSEKRIINFHAGNPDELYKDSEQFLDKNINEVLPPDLAERFNGIINETMETGNTYSIEYSLQIGLDTQFFEARTALQSDRSVVVVIRNVSHRVNIIRALEEEKEKLAVTLRSIGDGVIATDLKGRVTLINKVAEILTGWQNNEAIGKPFTEVFKVIDEKTREPKDDLINAVLTLGGFMIIEKDMLLIMKDGTERLITDSIAPIRDRESKIIGVVLVFREFAEKALSDKRITHLEKIESIGLLAGGIAHDFNNIMTSILGNISLAKFYARNDEKISKRLNEAEIASLRAKDLTQQLLTFSKAGEPVKEVISIEPLIRESASFALSGSRSKIEFKFENDLLNLEADPGQVSQVINNLVINADQAMPKGGLISIVTSNYEHKPETSSLMKPGYYILIEIIDSGIGIPRDILSRIFDPYFSTKKEGSGLGLSISYSIIKKHNGYIDVNSEPGKGTTFRIYLPASNKNLPHRMLQNSSIKTGSAKILIMDDEELVRSICSEILKSLGYHVETASHGDEAVSMFKNSLDSGERFNLVIMDLTIPGGIGGKEALQRIKEIDPDIRSIVASGYSNDPVMANHKDYGFDEVLTKPYKFEDLSSVVDHVLSL